MDMWGRCVHLRRTRPGKFFGATSQPSFDGIPKNITFYSPELFPISHQTIVTFILPKRLAGTPQDLIGLPRAVALQPPKHRRNTAVRGEKQMHMIGHDHPRMHLAVCLPTMLDRFANDACDLGQPKISRSASGAIQEPAHRHERLAGCRTSKPERNEQRLIDTVDVRPTAV